MSAVVGRKEIMDSLHPGGLGYTYGANPVACAAAHAVLDIFEKDIGLDPNFVHLSFLISIWTTPPFLKVLAIIPLHWQNVPPPCDILFLTLYR